MEWLNPSLWNCACSFQLATTEKKFHSLLRKMGVPKEKWPEFQKTDRANATTHFFAGEGSERSAIVCIPKDDNVAGIQVASLLVHEAVHIWQYHRELVGEAKPGDESEAYAIQSISQRLMEEFLEQTK